MKENLPGGDHEPATGLLVLRYGRMGRRGARPLPAPPRARAMPARGAVVLARGHPLVYSA
eukprot:2420325-Lingulodinium_polyedra.AAC.1